MLPDFFVQICQWRLLFFGENRKHFCKAKKKTDYFSVHFYRIKPWLNLKTLFNHLDLSLKLDLTDFVSIDAYEINATIGQNLVFFISATRSQVNLA